MISKSPNLEMDNQGCDLAVDYSCVPSHIPPNIVKLNSKAPDQTEFISHASMSLVCMVPVSFF